MDNSATLEFLANERWPLGLQDIFIRNLDKVPLRFFICDDSGSMKSNDGHLLSDHDRYLFVFNQTYHHWYGIGVLSYNG